MCLYFRCGSWRIRNWSRKQPERLHPAASPHDCRRLAEQVVAQLDREGIHAALFSFPFASELGGLVRVHIYGDAADRDDIAGDHPPGAAPLEGSVARLVQPKIEISPALPRIDPRPESLDFGRQCESPTLTRVRTGGCVRQDGGKCDSTVREQLQEEPTTSDVSGLAGFVVRASCGIMAPHSMTWPAVSFWDCRPFFVLSVVVDGQVRARSRRP